MSTAVERSKLLGEPVAGHLMVKWSPQQEQQAKAHTREWSGAAFPRHLNLSNPHH
ncbi:unnamed protein product [Ectocarpus fasciculatus]